MTVLGTLRVAFGDVAGGFELLEEAAVAAVSGELSTFVTGTTTCMMISACRDLSDFQRAREWTEAAEKWCERESVAGFPGICRVHRAELLALTGAWEKAEEELRRATSELGAYNAAPPMADGFYAIGQIRLRKGDLEGAEESLRQAYALGRNPQPALALVRLAQGRIRAAAKSINTDLAGLEWDKIGRARLLPAQVEIAIASGDLVLAREAANELRQLATIYKSHAMEATTSETWGRLLLAEGDPMTAVQELNNAIRHWRELAAPYEMARVRFVLATGLRAQGDEEGARIELETARAEFARLGAQLDLAAAEREVSASSAALSASAQVRKTFMFTDIVSSTLLAEALGNEAWTLLLQWHDDALRASFKTHRGEVVNSTGDGFFVAFDEPHAGIECAVAIQRELAAHRRTTGFAPQVRIGVHSADAQRHGDSYSGIGVHIAARVAAIGNGGEIVVTAATLEDTGEFQTKATRAEELKGVPGPILVSTVEWM
jgi:class 3 adenylate cyclase